MTLGCAEQTAYTPPFPERRLRWMISRNASLALLSCGCTVCRLLWLSLEQQVFVELSRKCGLGTVDSSKVFVVYVIQHVVSPILQSAQLDCSAPMAGEECIVHFLAFADHMGFGTIKADIVKTSEILSAREHFLFVNEQPFLEYLLSRWRQ